MRVFVAGVSSEYQYTKGVLAFGLVKTGPGDTKATHYGATGLVARKACCSEFLSKKEYDALLLLDLDMDYPSDILERLRAHDKDIVAGHYYRRQLNPMMSLVELSPDDTWPYVPILDPPKEGLHEIACAGFGCVLIKREVIEAVAKTLPPLAHPFDNGPLEWLTGNSIALGPDKRFFAMARKLGFKMYLDASVRCNHALTIWLGDDLYDRLRDKKTQAKVLAGYWLENLGRFGVNNKTIKFRLDTLSLEREALLKQYEADAKDGKPEEELQKMSVSLRDYDSRIDECLDWINGLKATVQFPTVPPGEMDAAAEKRTFVPTDEHSAIRQNVMTSVAMGWVEMLDERK